MQIMRKDGTCYVKMWSSPHPEGRRGHHTTTGSQIVVRYDVGTAENIDKNGTKDSVRLTNE
jgi:hypothetical protein